MLSDPMIVMLRFPVLGWCSPGTCCPEGFHQPLMIIAYPLGYSFCSMDDVFGEMLADTLRLAVLDMDHRLKGFAHPDALLTAVETRTSSPIRILRGDNMQAVGVCGLYPAGEGAGYAGGITSAAVDGIKVALAIIENFVTTN